MSYKFHSELWSEVETPKRKKDYLYKYIKLLVDSPNTYFLENTASPVKAGAILQIMGRENYGKAALCAYNVRSSLFHDNKERVLRVRWYCPTCNASHEEGLPESWIDEGKIVFVIQKSEQKAQEAA